MIEGSDMNTQETVKFGIELSKRGRKRKPQKNMLPAQFWAVRWGDTILGPFTTLVAAEEWAINHAENASEIYNMYAPLVDEPNKGHEIGTVYGNGWKIGL